MQHLIELSNQTRCITSFLQAFQTFCPNHPTKKRVDDVDIMKMIICRYATRTIYYGENLIKHINEAISEFESRPINPAIGEDYVTGVRDDAFFDFDAFIYSAKSILEGNTIERGKYLKPDIRKEFERYSKTVFASFIKPILTPIRDEIIHLNQFGTAIGSMLQVKNGKYEFKTEHFGRKDMVALFETILKEFAAIVRQLATFIMEHECRNYGYPKTDTTFSILVSTCKISDFVAIVP